MNDFNQGILYAAGILARIHDQPDMAAHVLIEAGLEGADCSFMPEFDRENLEMINGHGITLSGLNPQAQEQG